MTAVRRRVKVAATQADTWQEKAASPRPTFCRKVPATKGVTGAQVGAYVESEASLLRVKGCWNG
jgi:hypothetical protein